MSRVCTMTGKRPITPMRCPTPTVAPKNYKKQIYNGKEFGGRKATVG